MKQLNWYQIFGKSNIPDGRTVLPTDDIQIWLNCANIWDKAYTTLAEVLADTDTLSALINSENAVDYMVRSTTWAASITVPIMTSNTTPSGTVFASGYYSSYYPWKVFDGNDSTEWEVAGNTNKYIGYRFTEAVSVWKCKVVNLGYSDNVPKDCYIEYSDDNVTWTKVDGSDFVNSGVAGATTEVTIAESGEHEYWRLYVSNTQGGGSYVYIATLQFYSASITADSTAMTLIGANNYCANTLLADATWCEAICNSEYFESVLNVKVPTMTSETTPSGDAFASSFYTATCEGWRAFDGGTSYTWTSGASDSTPYVGYMFTSTPHVHKITMQVKYRTYSYANDLSMVAQYYDGDNWNDVKTISLPSESTSVEVSRSLTYILNNTSSGGGFRLKFNHSTRPAGLSYFACDIIQFYGREDV